MKIIPAALLLIVALTGGAKAGPVDAAERMRNDWTADQAGYIPADDFAFPRRGDHVASITASEDND